VAFLVAVAYTLNKLNADSEIVVISAAGISPWRLFVPFFWTALVVAILVAFISAYLGPKGLRELRSWAAKLRADVVTTIVKPGAFVTFERGLTFHVRERRPNGQLIGIFIDDRRDPKDPSTLLAEGGQIIENERGTYLVLENGSVQRREGGQRDPAIVQFERYAFDLSRFSTGAAGRVVTARERSLWELAFPDPEDPAVKGSPGVFRAEFHDRLTAPLYPIAFAMLTFAFLGAPATTRQSRAYSLGMAILSVLALRFIGFGSIVFSAQRPLAVVFLYSTFVVAAVLAAFLITRGTGIRPPDFLNRLSALIAAGLARFAPKRVEEPA
jgi:lipopolysaccharide export system permease protein